jgi:hypothetical protein
MTNINVQNAAGPRPRRDTEGHESCKDSSFMGSRRISSEPLQVHVEHSVIVGARPLTPAGLDKADSVLNNGAGIT